MIKSIIMQLVVFLFLLPATAQDVPAQFCYELHQGSKKTYSTEMTGAAAQIKTETTEEVVAAEDDVVILRMSVDSSGGIATPTTTVVDMTYRQANEMWTAAGHQRTLHNGQVPLATLEGKFAQQQLSAPNCVQNGLNTVITEIENGSITQNHEISISGFVDMMVLGENVTVLAVQTETSTVANFNGQKIAQGSLFTETFYHSELGMVGLKTSMDAFSSEQVLTHAMGFPSYP